MSLSDEAARVVTDSSLNKTQKIKRLASQGMRQTDIARALEIRAQFVSNVVRGMQPAASAETTDRHTGTAAEPLQARVQVGEAGRVLVPAAIRSALGMNVGDSVLLRVEGGELRILTAREALRRAQDLVRQFVSEDRSLAEELIADRRLEAESD